MCRVVRTEPVNEPVELKPEELEWAATWSTKVYDSAQGGVEIDKTMGAGFIRVTCLVPTPKGRVAVPNPLCRP